MTREINDRQIAVNDQGYLEDPQAWDEDIARAIAADEGIELTDRHWDVINYLRDEYLNNNQNQPNERTILKVMSKRWGDKPTSKDMYALFPNMPSKQGGKIAGLPESRRKGGY